MAHCLQKNCQVYSPTLSIIEVKPVTNYCYLDAEAEIPHYWTLREETPEGLTACSGINASLSLMPEQKIRCICDYDQCNIINKFVNLTSTVSETTDSYRALANGSRLLHIQEVIYILLSAWILALI